MNCEPTLEIIFAKQNKPSLLPHKFHKSATRFHRFPTKLNNIPTKKNKFPAKLHKFLCKSHKFLCKSHKSATKFHKFLTKLNKFPTKCHKSATKSHKSLTKLHKSLTKLHKSQIKHHRFPTKSHKPATIPAIKLIVAIQNSCELLLQKDYSILKKSPSVQTMFKIEIKINTKKKLKMIPLIKLFGWQLQIYIVLCVNKFWLFGISMCILKMFRFEHHIMNRLITDILILKH